SPPAPVARGTGVQDAAPRASVSPSSAVPDVSARSALPAETVRLPADSVSPPSSGHVAGAAVRTLIEATDPPPIMCHRFGVVLRETSVQRRPSTPTTTTGAAASSDASAARAGPAHAAGAAMPSRTATTRTRTAGTVTGRAGRGFTRPG